MFFWIIVALITIICLIAFYFLSQNKTNILHDSEVFDKIKDEISTPSNIYFKKQLKELEKNLASGLISEQEAQGAKAELAREILRLKAEDSKKAKTKHASKKLLISTPAFLLSLVLIVGLTVPIYLILGSPNLPSLPLALRTTPEMQETELLKAVEQVETRLAQNPEDARGWSVLAPIYMQMQRFDEAVFALQNVDRLLPPNADVKTDLAEALMMASDGVVGDEVLELLISATKLDPNHIRSRFYIAAQSMQDEKYEIAIKQWQELLDISTGSEQWVDVVREGLNEAQARLNGEPQADEPQASQTDTDDQTAFIKQMVERLETRLATDGGTIEEWTQLVRSLLVLGNKEKAQIIYSEAKQNFPDGQNRIELDKLATDAGLK